MSILFNARKPNHSLIYSCLIAALLSGCNDNSSSTSSSSNTSSTISNQLYTQTNEQANAVIHLARGSDGTLTFKNRAYTGGNGTNGVKLGDTTNTSVPDSLISQNSVIISPDKSTLFVVNAGNNTVSTFSINQSTGDLTLKKVNDTTGIFPTSLAYSNGYLYVSFEGGSEKVQAYSVNSSDGSLKLIGAYVIPANGANPIVPTQVAVSPNGSYLVVSAGTGSNEIVSYPINSDGTLGTAVANTAGVTSPFAGVFLNNTSYLSTDIVDKALASFGFSTGTLTSNGAPLTSGQGGPCWVVATPNSQFAYVGHGSGPIASYTISGTGTLTLKNAKEANDSTKVAGDSWISPDGKYLYTAYLADDQILAYSIGGDGTLTKIGNPLLINTVSAVSMMGLVGI